MQDVGTDGEDIVHTGGAPGTADLLAETPMFASASAPTLDLLAQRAARRSLGAGEMLFCQGDAGKAVYVVAEGLVKVGVLSREGSETVLAVLHPGDSFGELSVLDGGDRSATAVAVKASEVVVVPAATVREAVADDPEVAKSVLLALAGLVRRAVGQRVDLVFLDLRARVAKYLLEAAERAPGAEIDLQMSQSDLARLVGGSRQSVNQVLRAFERDGIVALAGAVISVRRVGDLHRLAEGPG